jgi:hypothetical protein
MLEHPNILSTRPTVRWENGRRIMVYVIETDLAVTPRDPAFDAAAFNTLAKEARARLACGPRFDDIRFEQVPLA